MINKVVMSITIGVACFLVRRIKYFVKVNGFVVVRALAPEEGQAFQVLPGEVVPLRIRQTLQEQQHVRIVFPMVFFPRILLQLLLQFFDRELVFSYVPYLLEKMSDVHV